jgi:hypothetical protein
MFNSEAIFKNESLMNIASHSGVTVGYSDEQRYLDFNLVDMDKQPSDALDLVTYSFEANKECFVYHGTQVGEMIDWKTLPQTLKCENDVLSVIRAIADKVA